MSNPSFPLNAAPGRTPRALALRAAHPGPVHSGVVAGSPHRPQASAAAPLPSVVMPAERPSVTRERLGRILAALIAAGVAVAALAERGGGHAVGHHELWARALVSVAHGLVLGAVVGITHRHRRAASLVTVAVAAVTGALALLYLGPTDGRPAWRIVGAVVTLAGLASAWATMHAARIARRAGAGMPVSHVLATDYPLVGLVWLTTPALWMLAAQAHDARGVAAATMAALFGSSLLASVRASRGPAARGAALGTALLVGAWAAVSMAPLLGREVISGLTLVGVMTLFAGATAQWLGPTSRDRRFEQRALVRASPALAGALALALLPAPAARPAEPFEAAIAWPVLDGAFATYVALALVAGYAAAELRGRATELPGDAQRRLTRYAGVAVAAAECGVALLGVGTASVWRALVALAAARLGVAVYHAHRNHVRALRTAGRARSAAVASPAEWPRR